jgi:predicted enzyme related to lactoylglutathione lyase
MLTGAHTIVFASGADSARAFFRDVLELDSVDAGGGWLIFALPPAEVAVHPDPGPPRHELYLMCDDIHATMRRLTERGAEFTQPVSDEGWGLITRLRVPGAGDIGLYEPRHPVAATRA